ncbi:MULTISPECIES: flagellar export chaperone FliS [Zoogloea]|jgi:flagellar protein FliS|uniref:Flagellar secretion chaperone FliS n=1 Tax=Zoogloea oleivorans TaxID=1552750 RepID=A0A6C2D6A0_9RHOO|nr:MULTISPECIES: flagellar export chaperone FliS [Zoogloea]MBT9496148.1 flagellar export chaperone FliS [Zoogloea sp.]MDD2669499.1 flagellar export chaperone FliS [Zoogloea sp.]MDY0035319.1 flagellar export chaperone FliS [Zoogloea oleivorans]TYC61129.1 flagellar export chaperone FliS [Zoogloea oleivorans]
MSFGLAARRAAAAYSEVGVATGVSTADPHKLILMLFEGAILQIGTAAAALENKNVPAKGLAISKAIEIITNGLKVSLDFEAGGDLAQRLGALYDYMSQRLLYANLHNSRPAMDEVVKLLTELKGAWEEIGTTDQAYR